MREMLPGPVKIPMSTERTLKISKNIRRLPVEAIDMMSNGIRRAIIMFIKRVKTLKLHLICQYKTLNSEDPHEFKIDTLHSSREKKKERTTKEIHGNG